MTRLLYYSVGVFLVALGLIAHPALAQRTLTIGGIFDLSSGAGALWGRTEKNALNLAIRDFEQQHPEYRVQLKIEDSAYSNTQSVSALQKLTSLHGIRYLVGPTWEPFIATIPICEAKHVICMAPSSNSAAFEAPGLSWVFTLWFDEREYSRVHAEELNRRGIKRYGVIAGISPYYDSLSDAFLQTVQGRPIFIERTPPEVRDFRAVLAKLPRDLEALIVFLLGDGGAQAFYRQWAELRQDRPLIYTDDAPLYFDPALDLPALGFEVRYSAPDFHAARIQHFNQRYRETFGQDPAAPSGSVVYDGAAMLLDCARQFDPDTGKVRKCLADYPPHQGMSGIVSFAGGNRIKDRTMAILPLTPPASRPAPQNR